MLEILILAVVLLFAIRLILKSLHGRRADTPSVSDVIGNVTRLRPRTIAGNGRYDYDIVGESNYQRALSDAAGGQSDASADLILPGLIVPEPENRFDPDALRVEIGGRTIGYIPRRESAAFHLALGGLPAHVQIRIVGGWERGERGSGSFGARLDVAWPPTLA